MAPKWGMRVALGSIVALSSCADDDPLGLSIIVVEACFPANEQGLSWPLDCRPGEDCWKRIGYPDLDGDGYAANCGEPAYAGHDGTDFSVTAEAMGEGVSVFAAADAEVVVVHDFLYDRCDLHPEHADCVEPPDGWREPGQTYGERVCTELSPEYCNEGSQSDACFRCFTGNSVVLRHLGDGVVFATYYTHLRQDSALVEVGDIVPAGSPIALVGSSGTTGGPHLHFEVWDRDGWSSELDPWSGRCSSWGQEGHLFANDPAWCE